MLPTSVREASFALTLLYPVESQKTASRNIGEGAGSRIAYPARVWSVTDPAPYA
jgi:hypothetical protein